MTDIFLEKKEIDLLKENYNFLSDRVSITIHDLFINLPQIIKIDDTEYYWRLIRLNTDMWECSYMRLNDNGDKDSKKKKPILHYFIGNRPIECLYNMLIWVLNRK